MTHTALKLGNPVRPEQGTIEVIALADTGAVHLCLPEQLAAQLALVEQEIREVTLADGTKRLLPYVGPVEVRFSNRRCFVGAMVCGDEVLLGTIPMMDMDLVVHPQTHEIRVNPISPNFAGSQAKSAIAGKTAQAERRVGFDVEAGQRD